MKRLTQHLGWVTLIVAGLLAVFGFDPAHVAALTLVAVTGTVLWRLDWEQRPFGRPAGLESAELPSLMTRFRLPSAGGGAPVGQPIGDAAERIVLAALRDEPDNDYLRRLQTTYDGNWRVFPRQELLALLDYIEVKGRS